MAKQAVQLHFISSVDSISNRAEALAYTINDNSMVRRVLTLVAKVGLLTKALLRTLRRKAL